MPKYNNLYEIHKEVMQCEKCSLHKTRKNIVFGEGSVRAKIMLIGEGPEGTRTRWAGLSSAKLENCSTRCWLP